MKGDLTSYRYEQELEMIAVEQEDFDAGRVHFVYDEAKGFWRRVYTG